MLCYGLFLAPKLPKNFIFLLDLFLQFISINMFENHKTTEINKWWKYVILQEKILYGLFLLKILIFFNFFAIYVDKLG